jgi:hypothetical protein
MSSLLMILVCASSQVRIAGISFEPEQLVDHLSGIFKSDSIPSWTILIL